MESATRILTRTLTTVSLACLLLMSAQARSVKQKKLAARTQFETAERMREALNGKPEQDRSKHDYQKVMDAFRKVYYTAPNSNKADAAVLAVAELLDEEGRALDEPKSFKDAIGQLEFLRREYPGSKHRAEALFTIAQIYRDDLDDSAQAKATFEEFLKHYPHSTMAPQAHQGLNEIAADASDAAKDKSATGSKAKSAKQDHKKPQEEKDAPQEAHVEKHKLPLVTNIRHWSTPDYTRVAIDLEQEVQYEAGRVPHPDRIFFDLHDTKLAADLVGKSFDVDDGFLHKIRIAQFKANLARVVLDVDDVTEYSAFLLPNPYRLIIDIHGKQPVRQVANASAAAGKPVPSISTGSTNSTQNEGTSKVEGKTEAKADAKNDAKIDSKAENQPESLTNSTPNNSAPVNSTAGNSTAASSAGRAQPDATVSYSEKSTASGTTTPHVAPGSSGALTGTASSTVAGKPAAEKSSEAAKTSSKTEERTEEAGMTEDRKSEDRKIEETEKATRKPTSGPIVQSVAAEAHHSEPSHAKGGTKSLEPAAHVAEPRSSGERSLIRALGLKIGRIVIDAGHGGHDTGTIGPNGLLEKDLVLEVALKLGKLLEQKLGAEVVYTRDDDTFIPLETRTAIANKEQADLFVSVHANSSSDPAARGVETYYLNFTSSEDALEVAARENAVSEKSIHELQDLVKKIALKEKIDESHEFASDVQQSLYGGLVVKSPGLRNRGVKKAPFIVLIGANMPSILAEISFVSNPGDEKKLKTTEYRQRIADSLYKGIAKYVNGLSGVKVATKIAHAKPGE